MAVSCLADGVGFEPTDACTSPVFKTGALNRSATHPAGCCLSPAGVSCARHAVNPTGFTGVLPTSLGRSEEGVLAGIISWLFIGASAASLASAARPVLQAPIHSAHPIELAQTYVPAQPQYAQPVRSAWDTYKSRLAILAAQQGVRQTTIQANLPGLT